MYCVHSDNVIAFKVLLEFKEVDLLWRNNTGANICQILAKKGLMGRADQCWEILKGKPEEDQDKFINNQSFNGMHANIYTPFINCPWTIIHIQTHSCFFPLLHLILLVLGWTLLHAAIHNDNSAFTQWLLQRNADPFLAMDTGWTPIHEAAKQQDSSYYARYAGMDPQAQQKASHK